MDDVSIHLDPVLAHYTKRRYIRIDRRRLKTSATVQHLLDELKIPGGMVGVIVHGGKLLERADILPSAGDVKMYGIYDGG